jgi:hypothetical protein
VSIFARDAKPQCARASLFTRRALWSAFTLTDAARRARRIVNRRGYRVRVSWKSQILKPATQPFARRVIGKHLALRARASASRLYEDDRAVAKREVIFLDRPLRAAASAFMPTSAK